MEGLLYLFLRGVHYLSAVTVHKMCEPHVSLKSCLGDKLSATFFALFCGLSVMYSNMIVVCIFLVKLLATQLAQPAGVPIHTWLNTGTVSGRVFTLAIHHPMALQNMSLSKWERYSWHEKYTYI